MSSRPLLAVAVMLTILAAGLSGVAVAELWAPLVPSRAMDDVRTAAAVAWVVAVMCWRWMCSRRRDDEREGLLIRTLANVTRPAAPARTTLPLRRVR